MRNGIEQYHSKRDKKNKEVEDRNFVLTVVALTVFLSIMTWLTN